MGAALIIAACLWAAYDERRLSRPKETSHEQSPSNHAVRQNPGRGDHRSRTRVRRRHAPRAPDLCTAGGTLHGGAIMAFADSLGAIGASSSLPEGAAGTTTLESKTNFLGGAKAGTTVTGEATPVHRRQTHQRLANQDQQRRRQSRRADHANADGVVLD
jgi:uncharacterized protein (TIGR00369 family)